MMYAAELINALDKILDELDNGEQLSQKPAVMVMQPVNGEAFTVAAVDVTVNPLNGNTFIILKQTADTRLDVCPSIDDRGRKHGGH